MCIVALAWNAHPQWQLVAIGNRDELHARPAERAHRWNNPDHLIAGRDSLAGGTWLGVSEQGRFAVVTNLYGFGTPQPDRASRGDLLKDFLSGQGQYAEPAPAQYSDFNPFNLITVTSGEAMVHANRPQPTADLLPHGIHGLSNGAIHQPWPKSPCLNKALGRWIADGSGNPEDLLDLLRDRNGYASGARSAPSPQTGHAPEQSPIFIVDPVYGTRCSTVVAIDHNGRGILIERSFAPSGAATGDARVVFSWPSQ